MNIRFDGTVDFQKTDSRRNVHIRVGRLNVDNLREAAWMMLFAPEAQEIRARSLAIPLPEGMEPVLERAGRSVNVVSYKGYGFSTSQTRLEWTWMETMKQHPVTGDLTWPNSYRKVESHAATLLDIAEKGMTEGCPPVSLPDAVLMFDGAPSVSRLDTDPQALSAIQDSLVAALRAYRRPAECVPFPHADGIVN